MVLTHTLRVNSIYFYATDSAMRFNFRLLAVIAISAVSDITFAQSSGTAFVVAPGLLVTNQHVVDGCGSIEVIAADGRRPATVVDSVEQIDLALLRVYGLRGGVASLRTQSSAMLGESATVFGFPLGGALSSTGNFTTGVVSSLRGLRDAAGEIQITAPVQPGNSGGPVLDRAGSVIGVVQSKLDALRTVKLTGDIPQNVNFAVSLDVLADFLAKNNVSFKPVDRQPAIEMTQVAEMAQTFTYKISCTGRSRTATAPRPQGPAPVKPAEPTPDKLVQDIQTALNQKGFNAGPADGFMGPQTQAAIRQAQVQLGLVVTGQPNSDLLVRISGMSRSTTANDISRSGNWDRVCSNINPNLLSQQVSRHIKIASSNRIIFLTTTDAGDKIDNPTVTWRVYISMSGRVSSFSLIKGSGSSAYDAEVKYAIFDNLRCAEVTSGKLPSIEFTHSFY